MSDREKTQDLLNHLIAVNSDKICVEEMALMDRKRRIDFWTLEPRMTPSPGFRATAYEIKVSRSDFKRDSEEKQSLALKYCDRFFYATPTGLLKPEEIPPFAGLIEFNGTKLRVKKRPPKRDKAPPSWDFVVGLIRNSTAVRRDTEFLKSELSIWKQRSERFDRMLNARGKRDNERWLRQIGIEPRA